MAENGFTAKGSDPIDERLLEEGDGGEKSEEEGEKSGIEEQESIYSESFEDESSINEEKGIEENQEGEQSQFKSPKLYQSIHLLSHP
jgi:hypothetical protein